MPKKAKSETTATETKTTKKRTAKKKVEPVEQQFNIEEIMGWDDEKCAEMDLSVRFPVKTFRDILREGATKSQALQNVTGILLRGEMTGYMIECPECHKQYQVSTGKLNRETEVTCESCGKTFKENENIKGISTDIAGLKKEN